MMAAFHQAARSVKAQYDLTDKICIITGGAGFLGRQFAEALGEMGGLPILLDVSAAPLAETAAQVGAYCGRSETEVTDVTDEASIRAAVGKILDRHGRIDVLVNAAALTKYGCDADPEAFFAPFESTDPKVWEAGLRVNLTGTMLPCKVVGPVMVKQRRGSIINIGSDVGVISPDHRIYQADPATGYVGMPFNTPAFYSTTKAAVIHLTRHLATLWAPYNVRVNAFSPAGVYRDHDASFVAQLASRIPAGRMGSVDEYKGAIVFLASDASSFMFGHNLVMDGGRTAW
jgi:NAD(P)-dependent dehydrogenase (short-subunit alcohol dehydrogenase family)